LIELSSTATLIRRTLLLLLAGCMAPAGVAADPQGSQVGYYETRLVDGVYQLDAGIDYRLTDTLVEALRNGIDLLIEVEIEITRVRNWWADADVATLRQRYRLSFHALSGTYQIANLNSGVATVYPSLNSALWAVGVLRGLPLIDASLLEEGRRYMVQMQARVEPESIPLPLRPQAYFSRQWQSSTDWYEWPLR
jgi:hypothetical protein